MSARPWTEPEAIRARVFTGDVSIPYVLAGEGLPVLLLRPESDGEPTDEATDDLCFRGLARHLRVVAPVLPNGGDVHAAGGRGARSAFSRQVRDFMDGLGLARVSVVAQGRFAVPALGFSLVDPERVRRLALVFRDELDPDFPLAAATDRFEVASTSLLVLRVATKDGVGGPWAERSLDPLLRFLTDTDAPTPVDTEP